MKLIFTVLVVLISSLASGQELKCSSKGTQILYLNEVLNTWKNAEESRDKIISILGKTHASGKSNGIALVDKNKVSVDFMYNESDSAGDFFETAAQKFEEHGVENSWKLLSNIT